LSPQSNSFKFNKTRAYDLIQKQTEIGPRFPGSKGIEKTRHLITSELESKWSVYFQNFTKLWIENQNVTLVNIVCEPQTTVSSQPSILLLAHYDTRLWADKDPIPQNRKLPVLGANDGASGVAIILELGRVLLEDYNVTNIQLLFFDGEDQGNMNVPGSWDWLIGSTYYAESYLFDPQNLLFGILLDMVGGKDAHFKREKFSDEYTPELVSLVWNEAHRLGYNDYFINRTGSKVIDDHVPLLKQGLPVIDIVDDFIMGYDPWHTTYDNMSFISISTLEAVGYTLESILTQITSSPESLPNFPSFTFQTSVFHEFFFFGFLITALVLSWRKKRV
jgi:Zn-dependent M28 family amino/carboxypeptidase